MGRGARGTEAGQPEGILVDIEDFGGERAIVDADGTGDELAGNEQRFGLVAENCSRQAIDGIVGELHGFADISKTHNRQHRPESLLGHQRHRVVDARDHGRPQPVAATMSLDHAAHFVGVSLQAESSDRCGRLAITLDRAGTEESETGRIAGIGGDDLGEVLRKPNRRLAAAGGAVPGRFAFGAQAGEPGT